MLVAEQLNCRHFAFPFMAIKTRQAPVIFLRQKNNCRAVKQHYIPKQADTYHFHLSPCPPLSDVTTLQQKHSHNSGSPGLAVVHPEKKL